METTESCKQCEKFELRIETKTQVNNPLELPNTYNKKSKSFIWKHTDLMAYSMIPRSVKGTMATVDMLMCIDEDLLDDIDIQGYATKFLTEEVLPKWNNVKDIHLGEPILGAPDDLPCWKLQHKSIPELEGMISEIEE